MARFLTFRLLQAVVVLLAMSWLVYALIGMMPGDPIDQMVAANPNLSPDDALRLKALYGLDQPLTQRYWHWLTAALTGDFGYSRLYHEPVLTVLLPRLGNTLLLLLPSLLVTLFLAIPLGVAAARWPHSAASGLIDAFSFAGIAIPPFWLALLLIVLFAVLLGWLPAGGMEPVATHDPGWWARLPYLPLPMLTLVLASIGGYTRYVRAAMRDALRQDYIRTARAKGVSESVVVWRHAFINALIPLVTILALDIGSLFSGALVTETLFAWNGMGRTIYDATLGNDYNLALMGLLLATAMTLFGSLLADIAYVVLDPRIRLEAETR